MHIVRVDALESDVLDIEFSNGNTLLLKLSMLASLPGFESLPEDDRILYPKTDGESVYWHDGPRLALADLQKLAFAETAAT